MVVAELTGAHLGEDFFLAAERAVDDLVAGRLLIRVEGKCSRSASDTTPPQPSKRISVTSASAGLTSLPKGPPTKPSARPEQPSRPRNRRRSRPPFRYLSRSLFSLVV
jgi:hypothetical protein